MSRHDVVVWKNAPTSVPGGRMSWIEPSRTTTIHTTQLTAHTRHLKIQYVQMVNNTKVRKYCTLFVVFFPHILYSRFHASPSLLTTLLISFSHNVSFSLFRTLHFISLHYNFRRFSLHFTSLLYTNLQHFIFL